MESFQLKKFTLITINYWLHAPKNIPINFESYIDLFHILSFSHQISEHVFDCSPFCKRSIYFPPSYNLSHHIFFLFLSKTLKMLSELKFLIKVGINIKFTYEFLFWFNRTHLKNENIHLCSY